jgi:hypothetical protein
LRALRVASAALVLLSWVEPARASRALSVSLRDCDPLSAERTEQLVRLELATVGGGESDSGIAEVRIVCIDAQVQMVATAGHSGRSLSRTIDLERQNEGADRVLAISVAQLVRALDWLPAVVEPAPPPIATDRQTAPRPRPESGVELQLEGGARLRQPSEPLFSRQVALRTGFVVSPGARVGVGIGYERSMAVRRGGHVELQLLGGGVGSSLEPWRGKDWSCLLRLDLSLQHLTARGVDASPGIRAARVRGFGGEVRLAAGPALRFADFGVAFLAEGGGAYFGGQALVSNDSPVSLNGAWAGVQLALLWAP